MTVEKLISHAGWIAILLCYCAFVLWVTYECHLAPMENDDDDIKIDDLIN